MSKILQPYSQGIAYSDQDFKAGKIHIVAPALNGYTNLNVFACLFGGIDHKLVSQTADRVNQHKICENLSPVAVTLLPLHRTWREAQTGSRSYFGDVSTIDNNILECINIHEEKHATKDLVFALDQGNVFDVSLFMARLRSFVQSDEYVSKVPVYYSI